MGSHAEGGFPRHEDAWKAAQLGTVAMVGTNGNEASERAAPKWLVQASGANLMSRFELKRASEIVVMRQRTKLGEEHSQSLTRWDLRRPSVGQSESLRSSTGAVL